MKKAKNKKTFIIKKRQNPPQNRKRQTKSKYFINTPIFIALSGGKSQRFGEDKMNFINARKVPKYQALLRRFRPHCRVYECAKFSRTAWADIILDTQSQSGAACALFAVAKFAKSLRENERVLLLAGDYFCAKVRNFRRLAALSYRFGASAIYLSGSDFRGKNSKFFCATSASSLVNKSQINHKQACEHVLFGVFLARDLARAASLAPDSRVRDFFAALPRRAYAKAPARAKFLRNFNTRSFFI